MGLVILGLTVVALAFAGLAWRHRRRSGLRIRPGQVGLEYRNGQLSRQLGPGLVHRPMAARDWDIIILPAQPVTLYPTTINVMSADQFAFRLTLAPVVQITDPARFAETQPDATDPGAALSAPLQAAALAEVAALNLDAVLADRAGLVARIQAALAEAVPHLKVVRIWLTDLTMPPEIRRMFTETERARREGLAALERARSEQAALRALANAARALEGNPALAHLRVLHAMESARGAKTFVLGGPEAVLPRNDKG